MAIVLITFLKKKIKTSILVKMLVNASFLIKASIIVKNKSNVI
jgi:hypothetical protein